MKEIIELISVAPFSILAGILFAVIMLVKTGRRAPLIKNRKMQALFPVIGFLLIIAGLAAVIVLAVLDKGWHSVDKAIGVMLSGILLIGLVAQTKKDKSDDVL